jgi:hypothetical protein
MATLQDQYNQILEGKGDKNHFLKQARHLFPEYVNHYNNYNETINILKAKSVLNESKAGLGMVSTPSNHISDWVTIFQEAVKAEEKKVSKEVTDTQAHNWDMANKKDIDNLYGTAFLNGFYTEMKDPKNQDKTTDEVKQIVAKNLGNDWEYYTTKAQFGVKGIGYQTEAPALGEPKAPKGKYKSSGYGDIPKKTVKENQETHSVGPMVKPSSNEFEVGDTVIFKGTKQKITRIIDDRIYIKSEKYGLRPATWVKAQDLKKSKTNENYESKDDFSGSGLIVVGRTPIDNNQIADMLDKTDYYGVWNAMEGYWFFPEDESTFSYLEADLDEEFAKRGINARFEGQYDETLNEAKRPNLASELKEIEKSNEALALEAKIQKVEEAIEKRQAKLKIAESEELAEMIDPSMVKTLHKEIKELEKYKAKAQKMYEKMTKTKSKEVIDEKLDDNEAVKSYENGI